MERRGIRTERGDINPQIEVDNQQLRQLKARLVKLQSWLNEEMRNTEPPNFAELLQAIFERRAAEGKSSNSQTMYNLKEGENMFHFLMKHDNRDMAGLVKYFADMIGR